MAMKVLKVGNNLRTINLKGKKICMGGKKKAEHAMTINFHTSWVKYNELCMLNIIQLI